MKPEIKFLPLDKPLTDADQMPLPDQDALRRQVPASTVAYRDGHMLLSREGVLHMAEEIIAGRTKGNVEAAKAMKETILREFPEK